MTRAGLYILAGFLLAHVVAVVGDRGRSWWQRYRETKWREYLIARGQACRRWIDGRAKRRAHQRQWAAGQMALASATPEGRQLRRKTRRSAARVMTRQLRAQAVKQSQLGG